MLKLFMVRIASTVVIWILLTSPVWAGFGEGVAAYKRGDYATAYHEFWQAAEQGEARSQFFVGIMHGFGRGRPKDHVEAIKWYRKAAEQGYARGQYKLGIYYEDGRSVQKSYVEAIKWYRKAATQGYAPALNDLGLMYSTGRGVSTDDAEAANWFRRAAKKSHAVGQFNLGAMYAQGRGVAQNYAEAFRWFHKAAGQGHAAAQLNVAAFYYQGRGVARNYVQAHKWLSLSARKGSDATNRSLAVVARKMTRAQIAKAQSLAAQWRTKYRKQITSSRPERVSNAPLAAASRRTPRIERSQDSKAKGHLGQSVGGSGFVLQLGAFRNRADAVIARDRIMRNVTDLSSEIVITGVQLKERGKVYRLQTRNIAAKVAARSLCRKFQARSIDCFVKSSARSKPLP